MLLFDRPNRPQHYSWIVLCILVTVGALAWFVWEGNQTGQWPAGSSLPGLVFGTIGGLIIIFECLLWVKKKKRVWRIGTAQTWLRAHIWLGLLCLPILILHSGLRWGGWLSTILMALLIIVVVSGIFGLVLQNWLPKKMLNEIPAETIYAQMDVLSAKLLDDAEQWVATTCGTAAAEVEAPVSAGAVVTIGNVQGKVLSTRSANAAVPDSEGLAVFFRDHVAPFLRNGSCGNPRLSNPRKAAVMFQELRTQLPPAAHEAVAALENFCERRRQWDEQASMHVLLHSWLWVHFPLSIALLVLMGVHVFVAFKFF